MSRYNPEIHRRRSIRLREYDYSQEGQYFITLCAHNREYLFGEIIAGGMILNDAGTIVQTQWTNLHLKYPNIELHKFVVMPNHFHGILQIATSFPNIVGAGSARPDTADESCDRAGKPHNRAGEPRPYVPTLGNVVAYFKYQTAKQINLPAKLWQRNYHEHIIRDNDDYVRIGDYIVHNPAQWKNDCFYGMSPHSPMSARGYGVCPPQET